MRAERIRIKRIYEAREDGDGTRILVDRLWPRGVSKEAAALDEWLKELAPSDALRRWFGHEASRFEEFKALYLAELSAVDKALVRRIRGLSDSGNVTLLYAARDPNINHAVVLEEFLRRP
jgi:uncharacterized protein YeaO (DUF488 family)